jgi:anti-anti-sigma regulatory factor
MSEKHGKHWLEREDFGDVTVVRLKPSRLADDDTTREIFEQKLTLLSAMGRARIVVNMEKVELMTTMPEGKFVMFNRKAQAAVGRLVLDCLSEFVVEVLRLSKLMHVFIVCKTEQEAIQAGVWLTGMSSWGGVIAGKGKDWDMIDFGGAKGNLRAGRGRR